MDGIENNPPSTPEEMKSAAQRATESLGGNPHKAELTKAAEEMDKRMIADSGKVMAEQAFAKADKQVQEARGE